MATKEIPFAESFGNYGDPRRYMNRGESPGKKVEQFVAKIRNSPLAGMMGIGLAGEGKEPALSSVPAPAMGQGVSVPAVPPMGTNPMARSGLGISPGSMQMSNAGLSPIEAINAPAPGTDMDGDGQVDSFWGVKNTSTPPQTFGPQSSVIDVTNETDFNPFVPDTGNQVAMTGNEYQQTPGFGSAQDKAGKLMKIMGMG
jgi:hypothetical protein